jgi:stringent starvation protein B
VTAVTPSRPYLIRAVYEWLLDNGLTPHMLIDAEQPGVRVPVSHVKDGQIVLNVSPTAVQRLELGNDVIHFDARFGGQPMTVWIPPPAVLGLYARENGRGMVFPEEPDEEPAEKPGGGAAASSPPERDPEPPASPPRERPTLKVVK